MAVTAEDVKKHWEEVSRIYQKLNAYIQKGNLDGIARTYSELHDYELKWTTKYASKPGLE